jgi:hypothetical protein
VASAVSTAARDAPRMGGPVGTERPARSAGSVAGAVARHIGLVLLFSVPAVILWWHVWDAHPASTVSCPCWDAGQQIWFLSWPAYALEHGLLPFFTSSLWTPAGVNLLNNTSAPLAGTVLAPITWLFGPIVSNNLALTLAPGLSAWSCWLACRRFVGWTPAAVLGGLLFGYSPFVVTSVAVGHLSIALLVVPPLTLVVVHELLVRQRPRAWVVGLLLGALVCAQFMISVEVLALMGIAVAVGVVATAVLSWPQVRDAFPYVVRALAVAAGVAVVVLAWPSWYLLAGPRHISGVPFQGVQGVANGRLFHLWSAGASSVAVPIPGAASGVVVGPTGDFVGFGVVLVALVSLVVARRRKVAWVMVIVALACIILSWGPTLWITSTHAVSGPWLPWKALAKLPIFRNILPVRFAIFTDLAVAVLIAVGIDTARTWPVWGRLDRSVGLARRRGRHDRSPTAAEGSAPPVGVVFTVLSCLVAALVLVPQWVNYQVPIATQPVVLPTWFATAGRTVRPGSTVLTYPFPMSSTVVSQPMVWQAVDGMRFRLAGGYAKVPGPDGRPLTTGAPDSAVRLLFDLTTGATARPGSAQLQSLRSALRGWNVSWIVVTHSGPEPEQAAAVFTAATGRLPTVTHDAWVWNLAADRPTPGFSGSAAARALEGCTGPTGPAAPDGGGRVPQRANQCVLDQLGRPA